MKTKNKILNAIAIIALLLGSNQLIAQTDTSLIQTVCAGSLAEPYLINPPTVGSTYQWTLSGGGTLNNGTTTDNITVDWGVTPGTYTITVTETDANGCPGSPRIVDVTVIPLPTATIATSQTACLGSVIPDLSAIGSTVTWYDDAALTSQVGVGNNFATGQTAVGLYTYYVTESLNGCEGPSVPVTLEIYAIPTAPTAVNQTACFGTTIPDLTASGTNLTWYSDASLTTVVGNGVSLSTNQTSSGLYTYYVTSTDVNGCESSAISVLLEIYAIPTAPTAVNQTACFGTTIPDLTASGTNLTWYSDASLTTVVGFGASFATNQTVAGVYTYYVTETNAYSCESGATVVTLTINAFTTLPVSTNQTACFGATIPDLTATGVGTSFTWYSDVSLNIVVGNGSPFSTGQTASGVYTYYVTESQNGCESPAATVTLEIFVLPSTGPIFHN